MNTAPPRRIVSALLILLAAGPSSLIAVNCNPPADTDGDWDAISWGSSGGVDYGLPGNNAADDTVYIRRNNSVTIDTDVSPSALGFAGGINALVVGDGFDGPSRGNGTLHLTGGGRLRVEKTNRSLANVSIVNSGRDRPNSVGTLLLDGDAVLLGATLNIGVTTVAYDPSYLATHTVPSCGRLTLSGRATVGFDALVLGTAGTKNAVNTAIGFPATSGVLELVGGDAVFDIAGSATFNHSGILRLTATTSTLPHPMIRGAVAIESGFSLIVDLSTYDFASLLAHGSTVTFPLITLADAGSVGVFLGTATTSITGYDSSLVRPSFGSDGSRVTLTLAPYSPRPSTGAGIPVSREPSPSALDLWLGRDIYVADPAIAVMPDGSYLIAHSIFGDGVDPANLPTNVFRSTDQGATWTQVTTMNRLQRASFFTYRGVAYCLGTGRIDGTTTTQLVIRKSTDCGRTWTPGPTTSADPGLIRSGGTGTPSTPVIFGNRVWMARATLGLSGDLDQDLMTPAAWSLNTNSHSNPDADPRPAYRDAWPAYNDRTFELWAESQIVASPRTGVVLMPKIQLVSVVAGDTSIPHSSYIPHTSLQTVAAAGSPVQIDPAHTFVPLPGSQKKFGAIYDPSTDKFYALTNTVLPAFETWEDAKHQGYYQPQLTRNTGTLYSSRDLVHWDLEKIFIHSDNVAHHAWQYFNFVIDHEDMIIASRTAFKTAQDAYDTPRGHDANLLTFHRIADYRNLTVTHTLNIANGVVTRAELTDYQPAPLGNFTLGITPKDPVALTETPDHTIVIAQQDAQLLHYDQQGNFLGLLSSVPAGATLVPGPIEVVQQRTPQRTYRQAAGGAWYDPRNWHYWSIADTAREIATFGTANTGPAEITIDRPTTVRGLIFRSPQPYRLVAADIRATDGTLYQTGGVALAADPDSGASPFLTNFQGHHTVAVPLTVAAGTTIDLAAGTTLDLTAPLILSGNAALAIDLADFDPDHPPLSLRTLAREGASAMLTIALSHAPADIAAATPILRIAALENLTVADINVTDVDGRPLRFSITDGQLSLLPPDPSTLAGEALLAYALRDGAGPVDRASYLPRLGVGAAGVITFTFNRLRAEATYVVEASSDLEYWSPVATNPGTVGDMVTVDDPDSVGCPRRFLRLKITIP